MQFIAVYDNDEMNFSTNQCLFNLANQLGLCCQYIYSIMAVIKTFPTISYYCNFIHLHLPVAIVCVLQKRLFKPVLVRDYIQKHNLDCNVVLIFVHSRFFLILHNSFYKIFMYQSGIITSFQFKKKHRYLIWYAHHVSGITFTRSIVFNKLKNTKYPTVRRVQKSNKLID